MQPNVGAIFVTGITKSHFITIFGGKSPSPSKILLTIRDHDAIFHFGGITFARNNQHTCIKYEVHLILNFGKEIQTFLVLL